MKKNEVNELTPVRTAKTYCKFIIPSLIGVLLFIFPIKVDNNTTIPIAICSEYIQNLLNDSTGLILLLTIYISFFGSCIYKVWKWNRKKKNVDLKEGFLSLLFDVKPIWFVIRSIGFIYANIIYLNIPLDVICSSNTGGLVYNDLLPVLFSVFLLAGIFLPLLLNFGLLEFTGALLIKVMKPLFGLPGRSAIDAIASWLGDGTIGVLLTSKQYEEGLYTEKEACVIGTNFSLVSITFSIVVINTVGLSDMFVPFYLTVTFACIIAAIVVPKLPPLSRKKNLLIDGSEPKTEEIPHETSNVQYGLEQALKKVESVSVLKATFVDGVANVIDMWINVLPIVLMIGTTALMIAEYTSFFEILGLPFVPLLKVLGIPEAVHASKTIFAGFADMLLPSVLIASAKSELTRFVVAALSVSQLIYISEVGSLLIASKIPVKLRELFVIFIERTLITLPIITLIAHLLFR